MSMSPELEFGNILVKEKPSYVDKMRFLELSRDEALKEIGEMQVNPAQARVLLTALDGLEKMYNLIIEDIHRLSSLDDDGK